MGNVCKTRASAPAPAASPAPAPADVPAPSKFAATIVQSTDKIEADNKTKNISAPGMTLPTSSWRALLQDKTLNPDAKPFVPENVPPFVSSVPDSKQAKEGKAAPGLQLQGAALAGPPAPGCPTVAEDDPEWMQYLCKRFQARDPPRSEQGAAGTGPSAQRMAPLRGRKFGAGAVGGNGVGRGEPGDGDGGGGNIGHVAIHTEAYLKLLKDGSSKKKSPNINATRRIAPKTSMPSSKGSDGSTALNMSQAFKQNDTVVPITTGGLASKWSSALSGRQEDESAEEVAINRTTQDDLWIDKQLLDKDLSDPAYYSETESAVANKSFSMHRLGRRPKAATDTIRTYVMQDLNFRLDQIVGMLLHRLQRFTDQQRSLSESQQHQQRRFVIGLKEVARRTKQAKLACVIVAPDIEEDGNSGGLDDRMRELLASAYQNSIPVIFALSRARLGKALGKSLHISVLGVMDARGAQGMLAEAKRLSADGQKTWLARLQK